MKWLYYCIYLYLLLKPYYIFKSGSIQPSDIFLSIGFIVLLIVTKKNKNILMDTINNNKYFMYFLILSSLINIIYFLNLNNFKFILSSIYIIFIFISIIIFSFCYKDEKFILNMSKLLKFNIIIQLVIFVLGLGKHFDAYRYMGTFNDPNQFGYYILISLTFIYLIKDKLGQTKREIIITLIAIVLIIKSASTGMLLGLILLLAVRFYKYSQEKKILKYISIFLFSIIIIVYFINGSGFITRYIDNNDNFLVSRINDKLNRTNSSSTGPTLIQERGYDKIIKNPKYILYGSGEGMYERFNGYGNYEIHATFPSLLFYYGIIPFVMIIKWIFHKLKNKKAINILLLLPLFIESFTLLNQRQVLFWIIILFYEFYNDGGNKQDYETCKKNCEIN